jgi:hypothetical protein
MDKGRGWGLGFKFRGFQKVGKRKSRERGKNCSSADSSRSEARREQKIQITPVLAWTKNGTRSGWYHRVLRLPPGGPVIVSILVVGWYVGGLGLPANPAGQFTTSFAHHRRSSNEGAATLLQTAQGGHIVVRIDMQVDARSNSQARDGEGRAGDHCVKKGL